MQDLQGKIKQNQTPLLITLLTVLTGFLVIIAIAPKRPSVVPPPAEKKQIVTPAHTVLSFENASSSSGAFQSVNIVADSSDNKVTGVQIELAFDPTLVSNVSITPGIFIKNPVELLKKVDYTAGRITYVLGVPIGGAGVQGKGVVAILNYTEASAKGKVVEIKFLPKSLVAIEGFSGTALKSTSDYSKVIGGSPSPSPSAGR